MSPATLSRRSFVLGAAMLAAPAVRAAVPPQRVATVDWALTETLLALDHAPVAAVELELYRQIVLEPAVPPEVVDLGLRGSINFEQMVAVAPDIIYGSNYSEYSGEFLRRIAMVRNFPLFLPGERPLPKAESAMRLIAADLAIEARADRYIAECLGELDAVAARLALWTRRPLLIANLGDSRHFRAFGLDSMFGDVAERLGFRSAWGARTSYSATAPVGIERIADMPDAIVAVIGPIPPDARRTLPESALWQAMPAVRENRLVVLDTINPFGGLPAARRFARLLAEGLEALA